MIKPAKIALQRTSLQTGNFIAWIFLSGTIGFILGWILNAERFQAFCFPVA